MQANATALQDPNKSVTLYDIGDGLPSMQIDDIFKDSNGAIWLATRGGLSQFNGNQFVNYTNFVNAPLAIVDIAEKKNGNLVLLQADGVSIFDGASFKFIPFQDNYSINSGSVILDWEDRIWIHDRKLKSNFVIVDDAFVPLETIHPTFIKYDIKVVVPEIENESFIIVTAEGDIKRISDQEIQIGKVSEQYYLNDNINLSSKDGATFFTEHLKNGTSLLLIIKDGGPSLDIAYVYERSSGRIEFNDVANKYRFLIPYTSNNLIISDYGIRDTILTDVKKKYNYFQSIKEIGNRTFIGTDKGLLILSNSIFENYSEKEHPYVWTVIEHQNEILLGSYGSGIHRMSDLAEIITYDSRSNVGKQSSIIKATNIYMGSFRDNEDHIYFPYSGGILKYEDDALFHFYPKKHQKSYNPTLFAFYDEDTKLIYRAKCPGIEIISEEAELIKSINTNLINQKCVLTILKDLENNLWFGGRGGITKYNLDSNIQEEYLSSTDQLPLKVVVCSYLDSKGNLWLGGKKGLVKYNPENDVFEEIGNLSSYSISSLIGYKEQKLFAATVQGLLMIDLPTYQEKGTLNTKLFNEIDGLKAKELGQNGFYKDTNEDIWITSATNLVKFDPDDLNFSTHEIKAVIRTINERAIPFHNQGEFELEYGIKNAIISFGIPEFKGPAATEFRYQLNDSEWSSWSQSQTVNFNSLPSGKSNLDVQARYAGNNKIPELTSSISIVVDIPFYYEKYFPVLLTFLLLSTMFAFFYINKKNIYQKNINALLKKDKQQLIFEKEELEKLNHNLQKKLTLPRRTFIYDSTIDIKSNGKMFKIEIDEIIYITAEDNGIRLFFSDKSIWTDQSLKLLKAKLPDQYFFQIHRSHIVNIKHSVWVNQSSIKTDNGDILSIGRKYKKEIMSVINRNNS